MSDYRKQQVLERKGITEYNAGSVQIEEVEEDTEESGQGTTSSWKKFHCCICTSKVHEIIRALMQRSIRMLPAQVGPLQRPYISLTLPCRVVTWIWTHIPSTCMLLTEALITPDLLQERQNREATENALLCSTPVLKLGHASLKSSCGNEDMKSAGVEMRVKDIMQRAQKDANARHQELIKAKNLHRQQDVLRQQITSRNMQRAERRASCKVRRHLTLSLAISMSICQLGQFGSSMS